MLCVHAKGFCSLCCDLTQSCSSDLQMFFFCLTLLFLMLLGFHESVFHFCQMETTYVICVKCCHCIPNNSTPFAQFFLLKVNGNLVICSPPIYTGDLLITVHNLQQKDSEEREAWISFAINGIVEISRPVSSANSQCEEWWQGSKKSLDRYEDRPFYYMYKNPVVF